MDDGTELTVLAAKQALLSDFTEQRSMTQIPGTSSKCGIHFFKKYFK